MNLLRRLNPPQIITLSFLTMILAGACLLNLPFASKSGESIGFINALFTATSANCVTGLIVVNTAAHWSLFGKCVILVLIQAGALGLVTILTISMVVFHQKISLKDRMVIQAAYNQNSLGGMVKLVRRIVFITFLIEAIGACLLTIFFYVTEELRFITALWYGIFHSVSAFCNAGFDILGPDSLMPWHGNLFVTIPIMLLIVSGGLGFTVWVDIYHGIRAALREKHSPMTMFRKFTLHTKLVLITTLALIVSGTILFLLLEWNNPDTIGQFSVFGKLEASLFQSITLRTAGFNSISQEHLSEGSLFLSCLFMMVGGSPGSTAGGMKTVTIAVIMIAVISALRGRSEIEVCGRSLELLVLQKALTVMFAVLAVIVSATFLLYITEQNNAYAHSFLDLFFECTSASATVGISTGITPYLSSAGKIVITFCMFLGRLSPVTVVVALNMKQSNGASHITYPNENVIIG